MAVEGRSTGAGTSSPLIRLLWSLRVDPPLLLGLVLIAAIGLVVLYSAGGESSDLVLRQGIRLGIGLGVLLVAAQIPPRNLWLWTPWLYMAGIALLILVLIDGKFGGGAQRWIDLGLFTLQPSEGMKVGVPMMVAWYLGDRPIPPSFWRVLVAGVLIGLPAALVAVEPDLGTALLITVAGALLIFLAGLRWRVILGFMAVGLALVPSVWHFMHDYQRQRVMTFLRPESDPLGAGYHIIQSEIAIGSGGLYGKGWLNGTQAHLDFLPERSTDFIFAVFGEEFGLIGSVLLLILFVLVVVRALILADQAQHSYGRLLAGSLALTFFVYVVVNMGMVIGLLPVVGVPLPLVSYGGTSVVTLLGGFGVIMSIRSERRRLFP